MVLDIRGASEEAGVCGTLTVGSGIQPPPATDPDVGYPPGLRGGGGAPPAPPGFSYTLLHGTVQDSRVRFDIGNNEPWRGWCGLQTPVPDVVNAGRYGCLPNGESGATTPAGHECFLIEQGVRGQRVVDCGKLMLCNWYPVCACNASSCDAKTDFNADNYDLHFDAAAADGSKGNSRVRFFRAD
jgi:hypothetical protein